MDKSRLRELAGIIIECDGMGMMLPAAIPVPIAVRHEDNQDDEGAENKEIETLKGELVQIEKELSMLFGRLNGVLEKVSGKVKEEQLENEPGHVRMYRNLQRAAWDATNGIEGVCHSLKTMFNSSE
ncbi:MAG: hypothetical protein ACREAU_00185 [Nitrosopumilaceae archaeon]